MEHHRRGGPEAGGAQGTDSGQGTGGPIRRPRWRGRLGTSLALRHRRVRPGLRRRLGARLGSTCRRRPGHRQVDPLAPGAGGPGPRRRPVRIHLGRGSKRPDPHARPPARLARGTLTACRRDQRARHPHQSRQGRGAPRGGDRFDPDHVRRQPRLGPRHGCPGTRQRPGTRWPRQAPRPDHDPGRPRHQGRTDRGPQGAGAHGRHGALLRGRAEPPVPHITGGEKPLRPHRRDRRIRNDRCRLG